MLSIRIIIDKVVPDKYKEYLNTSMRLYTYKFMIIISRGVPLLTDV